jgi:hypothetical protein
LFHAMRAEKGNSVDSILHLEKVSLAGAYWQTERVGSQL